MSRLFAGTQFDIPPTCDRCGKLEEECECQPLPEPDSFVAAEKQSAKVRVDRRKHKRLVTVVWGLNPTETDLPDLLSKLKSACGSGGSFTGRSRSNCKETIFIVFRSNSAESATKFGSRSNLAESVIQVSRIMNPLGHLDLRRSIAKYTTPPMFFVSLAFLVCQAILVVVWVDVPNLSENALVAIDPSQPNADAIRRSLSRPVVDQRLQNATVAVMMVLWPLVIVEAIWHWISRPWNAANRWFHLYSLIFCLCPSLRMCARSPEMHGRLWLPNLKWRYANRRLRKRLERRFSLPMILIALLIMPVLIIEFFMKAQVAQYMWLRTFLHVGTGVIWFAFAFEFILMVSVAKKKVAYCKEHWIDLAIIILPLFSFLRTLQMFRATRIAHFVRLPMLTKLARVYRLRGTAVKALKGLLVLEFFHRVAGTNPQRRIEKLRRQLDDVELEAKQIRREIVKLERMVTENAEP